MNLIGTLDKAKEKGTKSETLVKQIESIAFQVVQNVSSCGPHNTETLEQILQNLKSELLLSSLNNNSTISETMNLHNEAPRKGPVVPHQPTKTLKSNVSFQQRKKHRKKSFITKNQTKTK